MANDINVAVVGGNLTRDAELRVTQGGTKVLTFTVANSDQRMVDGRWEDSPNFVQCVLYGERAEGIKPYMTKGRKVTVSGRLKYRSWEREGERRSALELRVADVQLSGRPEQTKAMEVYDGEIPF